MKKYLIPILILITIFIPKLSFADTIFEGNLDLQNAALANGGVYNMTKDGSPYIFNDGASINQNITLNVAAGVEIILNNADAMIFSNGTYNFNGTQSDPIKIHGGNTYSNGFGAAGNSTSSEIVNLNLTNVYLSDMRDCLYLGGRTKSVLRDISLSNCRISPIGVHGSANVDLQGVKYIGGIGNFEGTLIGISVDSDASPETPLTLKVTNTTFDFNSTLPHILFVQDFKNPNIIPGATSISFSNNSFLNYPPGVTPMTFLDNTPNPVSAAGNYWGNESGPTYDYSQSVNENRVWLMPQVSFDPFLPSEPSQYAECCSSVLFIPGIEGSRLYNKRTDNSEDQLWEPNTPADIEELYGDTQGNTDPSIYTRDLIKETNVLGNEFGILNIYKKISENLTTLKEQNKINAYKELPYDWRENVDDILTNGIKLENSTVNILDEIQSLANSSQTGKVTIIAHSNGGLLTKAIVKKLDEQGKANLIDKVVFVGVPQIGTPDAVYGLIHGIEFNWKFRNFSPQRYNRELAKNTESAYSLLPSQAFYTPGTVPVYFDSSLGTYGNLISSYGNTIDSYSELKQFILGQLDGRGEADFSNTSQIGLGNEYLYNKAEPVHGNLDNYNMPSNIKFYKVSGTGDYTNESIIYKKSRTSILGPKIDAYLKKNIYGDGTVLNKSSNWGNGDLYYFDLYNYNRDTKNDLSHADIFEANPIVDFVKNIIIDLPNSVNYISQNLPDYSNVKTTKVSMHSPVDIHLYDNAGRHTGPVYVDGQKYIEENIPNSKYEVMGDVASIIVTGSEEYHLKLDGYDTGVFTLDIEKFTENTQTSFNTFENLPANTNLSSDITISPDTINDQIILDTNSDGKMDLQSNSDGTLIDLTKHDCSGKIKDKKGDKAMNCKN